MFPVFNAANCIVDFGGLWCGNGEFVVRKWLLVVRLLGFGCLVSL